MKKADKKYARQVLAIAEDVLKSDKSLTPEQRKAFRNLRKSARAFLKTETQKKGNAI